MKLIKWINTNPGSTADEHGYWVSSEGRFDISPNYRHTIYPDSYTVNDRLEQKDGRYISITLDRIRDCKAWAETRAFETLKKNAPTIYYKPEETKS